MTAQHPYGVEDQRRFDVQLAIPETRLRPRMAIVDLIGMQHHDLTRPANLAGAAIVEGLDAACRQTDGVGVVAMLVICGPLEPGFQQFNPVLWIGTPQPIGRRLAARSFKTDPAGFATLVTHRDRSRCSPDEKGPQL